MITIEKLLQKKRKGEKIVMLTAYDYPLAKLVEGAGVDMILVGDSGGMVTLGYKDTLPVTMEEMLVMVKAVRRGAPNTFIIADMPFMSYQPSIELAISNAGRLIKEGGANAVKLEGGVRMAKTVAAITDAGIAVQGHIGLTPQNTVQLSGYKVQGKNETSARALIEDAEALEKAGIFSLILECVPVKLAQYLTGMLDVPTIGTGAGNVCAGQNLITPDILGYYDLISPRYTKKYANISATIAEALAQYKTEVVEGIFPAVENTYPVDGDWLDRLIQEIEVSKHKNLFPLSVNEVKQSLKPDDESNVRSIEEQCNMDVVWEKSHKLSRHPIYDKLKSIENIKIFMETHVFAVWDFMSLLKSLQRRITCVEIPWVNSKYPDEIVRFINEIVLGEESDIDMDGNVKSHFGLYLDAMREIGADTSKIMHFIKTQKYQDIPLEARDFVQVNLHIAKTASDIELAATFLYGREKLIPHMFSSIVEVLNKNNCQCPTLLYYLKRHIEVDGDHHGPLAQKCLDFMCEGNEEKLKMAEKAALLSLGHRRKMWDKVLVKLNNRESAVA